MKILVIGSSHKLANWLVQGIQDYTKRLPAEYHFQFISLPAVKRHKTLSKIQLLAAESQQIQRCIPASSHVIALDDQGEIWDTPRLAEQLTIWQTMAKSVSLLIGGADGLAPDCLKRAQQIWSLSRLTFPHGMVRLLIAEQLYRASTILKGHPYHRE